MKPRVPPTPPAGNGAHARPQGDLFAPAGSAAVAAPLERPAAKLAAADSPKPIDKQALRALLAELEALRAVMTGEPAKG